jgi:hypothetical protein
MFCAAMRHPRLKLPFRMSLLSLLIGKAVALAQNVVLTFESLARAGYNQLIHAQIQSFAISMSHMDNLCRAWTRMSVLDNPFRLLQ